MGTFKFAFKKTIPILFSYLFMGSGFGILLRQAGYDYKWAFATSGFVYAGALQYVLIPFLQSGASLTTVAMTALLLNSRHIFYGISYIEKIKKTGKLYPYMVFSLTDETYALLNSSDYPAGVNEGTAMLLMALLNQCYWIIGSLAGTFVAQIPLMDFSGIEFCMTALFITIVIEQWKGSKAHFSAIAGLTAGILLLLIFGSISFILPALLFTLAAISIKILLTGINTGMRGNCSGH